MDEELRAELLRRVAADQQARHAMDVAGMAAEYGTQAIARDGRFVPAKLRDPDRVDQRRASVGLGPLAGYLARMAERRAPEPMRVPCPACQVTIEVWPPEAGETRTATCRGCGQSLTLRRD
ncbi:MAG: hypothetical protein ABSA02_16875 [Trebonia sp.]|jgi:hypothetical protein